MGRHDSHSPANASAASGAHTRARVDAAVLCPSAGRGVGDGAPTVPAIVQSTTFARDGVGSNPPHQYSRVSNPTVAQLERALGAIEHAGPAVCFATGLAAETALCLALLRSGDHVVCGQGVYGGTVRLLREVLTPLGVRTSFVDTTDPAAAAAAIGTRTRLVFVETPSNPLLEITDVGAIADLAHAAGAVLAVDNTFQTGVCQRPLDLGADVSVYSTTKLIDGHSLALGGALVSKDADLLDRVRFVRKCTGAIQTPFNAWATLNGLRTLPVRMHRQGETAHAIARWLADQPGVAAVQYPALGPDRALADAQHLPACGEAAPCHGAVVSFELAGGLEPARRLARSVELCALAEHVGSVDTLLTHPATMTHADVPGEQRRESGLADGLLRLSVGLEPPEAIIADLRRGLDAAAASDTRRPACATA